MYVVDKKLLCLPPSRAMWRAIPVQRAIPKASCYQLLVPNTSQDRNVTGFEYFSHRTVGEYNIDSQVSSCSY